MDAAAVRTIDVFRTFLSIESKTESRLIRPRDSEPSTKSSIKTDTVAAG